MFGMKAQNRQHDHKTQPEIVERACPAPMQNCHSERSRARICFSHREAMDARRGEESAVEFAFRCAGLVANTKGGPVMYLKFAF
jgi:hypothetical protein